MTMLPNKNDLTGANATEGTAKQALNDIIDVIAESIGNDGAATTIARDTITEKTPGAGVTVGGVFTRSGGVQLESGRSLSFSGWDAGFGQSGDAVKMTAGDGNGAFMTYYGTVSALYPGTDNAVSLGTPLRRLTTVYAVDGAINTSDAEHKTPVRGMTGAEIAASKDLAGEIGFFKWLHAIEAKGEKTARDHCGMTVQRAVEIMQAYGLDPFAYGFICHDTWAGDPDDEKQPDTAGEVYAFRRDELLAFIAAGIVARQDAVETRLSALEAAAP